MFTFTARDAEFGIRGHLFHKESRQECLLPSFGNPVQWAFPCSPYFPWTLSVGAIDLATGICLQTIRRSWIQAFLRGRDGVLLAIWKSAFHVNGCSCP